MNPSPTRETKRVYLAGPMQGIPEFNFPRFHAVAYALRQSGHEVFSPAEKDIERLGHDLSKGNTAGSLAVANAQGFSLRQALAEDTNFICLEANCIVLLPGWEKSNGAQAEHRLAVALQSEDMEILYVPEELCQHMEKAFSLSTAQMREDAYVG